MRWVALILLAGNLGYLGWELNRETRSLVANSPPPLKIPAGTETLKIMDEAAGLQELKPVYGWRKPVRVLAPNNPTRSRKK